MDFSCVGLRICKMINTHIFNIFLCGKMNMNIGIKIMVMDLYVYY